MFRRAIWDKLPELKKKKKIKFPEQNEGNFKMLKNHNGNLSQKSPFVLKLISLITVNRELQNNSVNVAMLITINRVITLLMYIVT